MRNQQFSLFTKSCALLAMLILASWSLESLLDAVFKANASEFLNQALDLACVLLFALIGSLAFMRHLKKTNLVRKRNDREREIMLAGISHDLRTPLTRIRLEIELSAMSEHSKSAIDQDLAQIEHTLGQLMTYAKTSQTRSTHLLNLSEVLHDLISREQTRWQAMNIELTTHIASPVYVRMHQHDIIRVLNNLIDNALRYGRDTQGRLCLSINLARSDELAFIEIADRGAGISPADTDQLRRPFVRGRTAQNSDPSTGLGLAIVERLLRRAGASLSLSQRNGGGLSAQVCLSCFQPTAASKATTVAAIPSRRPK